MNDACYEPDVKAFLIELRKDILCISIEEFIEHMGWNNEKYYQQIVNGYKDNKTKEKKYKQPTVFYLFKALNYAMNNSKLFIENKKHIERLIYKHIIKW